MNKKYKPFKYPNIKKNDVLKNTDFNNAAIIIQKYVRRWLIRNNNNVFNIF